MAPNNAPIIPGDSPDPENNVERFIKVGWTLGGMFVSAGVLTYALNLIGFTFLPKNPKPTDYARAAAFLISCINILCWVWFPLEDLRVLRKWVRTKKVFFSAHTSEFLGIVLATFLLVALTVSSTINTIWFGSVGAAVYIWNFIGFAIIRKQVANAVNESKLVYSEEPNENKRAMLLKALKIIEKHWSCAQGDGVIINRQQIRHMLLAVSFVVVAVLGIVARFAAQPTLDLHAYILGALIIIAAESSIPIWRISRDRSLHAIFEDLRALSNQNT